MMLIAGSLAVLAITTGLAVRSDVLGSHDAGAKPDSKPVDVYERGEGPIFWEIDADDLNGDVYSFPGDLEGRPTLALVAFRQLHQIEVNTWLEYLGRFEAAAPELRVVEFPTVAGVWKLAKGWIDDGMRSGIKSRDARARTITLFTNVGRFRRHLGIDSRERPTYLLLDKDARVVARWVGPADDETISSVLEMARPLIKEMGASDTEPEAARAASD